MGYLSWIIALVLLALGSTSDMSSIMIFHQLFQYYAYANVLFLAITGFLTLASLFGDEESMACTMGVVLFFRILLTAFAFIMAGCLTSSGLVSPAWFWALFVFSVVFGGL